MVNLKKILPFNKYLVIAIIIVDIITLGMVGVFKILPLEYFIVLSILLVLISIILIGLILTKNIYRRMFGSLMGLIYIILLILFIIYKFNNLN